MRYERKYRIEDSSYDRVLHELLSNPASFVSAYPDRRVNSIYYDDIDYTSYNDNLLGISNRVKYRIRWYGDDVMTIKNPILEKKIKRNQLGAKELKKLDDFRLNAGPPDLYLMNTNQMYPYVIISYDRKYLISMDGLLRATIDKNLSYYSLINGQPTITPHTDKAIIVELKYEDSQEETAKLCSNALSFRMTKNSKYVNAMRLHLQ